MSNPGYRWGMLALIAAALGGLGADCLPLINFDEGQTKDPEPSKTLTVSANRPASDREVPQGAQVEIQWTAANLTGEEAIATVLLRNRSDLTDTIVAGGVRVDGTGTTQTVDWDTTDFAGGRYGVIVRVATSTLSEEDTATGEITVNTAPSLAFTEPFEDVTLGEDPPPDPNSDEDPVITIRWSGFDPEGDGTYELGVDTDLDHESENEFVIDSGDLPATSGFETFEWDGTSSGDRVDAGVYNLYAVIQDDSSDPIFVEGLGTITVPAEPNTPDTNVTLEFTNPTEDTTFLTTDDPLDVTYTIDEDSDVLIDLSIDVDDNHKNGNETIISAQRLIDTDTKEDTFAWDGTDKDGAAVPHGIYRVYMVINRGSGTPATIDADGLVFRRATENEPLIALLAPATDTDASKGEFVTIKWRDDDPDETAIVRLTLDDDPNPNQTVETGIAEIEILPAPRDAKGDDVQDTFAYQIPNTLNPDTYYVFAYIDADGVAPYDNVSVAAGRITVPDPDK